MVAIDFFAKDPDRPEGPVFRKKDSWCLQFFLQKIQIIGKGQSVAKRTVANDNLFCKKADHRKGPVCCKEDSCQGQFFLQKIQIRGKAQSIAKTMVANDNPDHRKRLVCCKEDGCQRLLFLQKIQIVQKGRLLKTFFCKRTRSYERAHLLQRDNRA